MLAIPPRIRTAALTLAVTALGAPQAFAQATAPAPAGAFTQVSKQISTQIELKGARQTSAQGAMQTSAQGAMQVPMPASKESAKQVSGQVPRQVRGQVSKPPVEHADKGADTQRPDANDKPVAQRRAKGPARVARTAPALVAEVEAPATSGGVKELVSLYAQRYNVPETLAHRVVIRESRYNPGLTGRGHYGLMQISLPTARQMGYAGSPQGLLDARTNLAHGMPYLANAWIVSGGSEARAVSLYSRGYYYDAKRKGLLRSLHTARSAPAQPVDVEAVAVAR